MLSQNLFGCFDAKFRWLDGSIGYLRIILVFIIFSAASCIVQCNDDSHRQYQPNTNCYRNNGNWNVMTLNKSSQLVEFKTVNVPRLFRSTSHFFSFLPVINLKLKKHQVKPCLNEQFFLEKFICQFLMLI